METKYLRQLSIAIYNDSSPAIYAILNEQKQLYISMSQVTDDTIEGEKMLFHRRKATDKDVPGICRVYYSAFMTTSLGQQTFPKDLNDSVFSWEQAFREDIANPHTHVYVITDPGSKTPSEPIAFAKWVAPSAPAPEAFPIEFFPDSPDAKLACDFSAATTKAHKLQMEDRPHWFLGSIAVTKEYMGKGAASSLMRWGTERADAEKMPCYLDSLDTAAPIYKHFGFEIVGMMEAVSEGGDFASFSMVREPVTRGTKQGHAR